ncbi:amidohydrolase family protein [Paralcaligenes sp. KSB-10]|jgi:predicted TIM-barrel fold metal-dependent hydrolase|uniref:amidohydrolase family protein n=1 Tax=Paralcaligenes sp. KSB-10 TaxID=2901142 RepID=UPI001E423FF7|nr:amidohydrolase family protein [Paralcaligenes sp. KSB-10]UHL65275.1 amidohydrolase family protein [Paralcaligenes sp. KSB-10]
MFDYAPPLEQIAPVRHRFPAHACDSHCHIFGPSAVFPFAEKRPYTPPDAPFEKLQAMHDKLGISRTVLVQAACHGYDMSAVLDAIARSRGQCRGVALLAPDVSAGEIKRLHEGGIRGARFHFMSHLAGSTREEVEHIAGLIAPHGWHICVHGDEASVISVLPWFTSLNVPFVIDHMARVSADKGVENPNFQALLDLKSHPGAWVKISGIDRVSSSGKRPFADGRPLMRALIEHMPNRLLWGTDWPHPRVQGDMPDDGDSANTLLDLCPDPAVLEQILVANPQVLYGFDEEVQA